MAAYQARSRPLGTRANSSARALQTLHSSVLAELRARAGGDWGSGFRNARANLGIEQALEQATAQIQSLTAVLGVF